MGWNKVASFAFTEPGVAMLSGVLNCKRAIQVNIQIMRVFVTLRELLTANKDLAQKSEEMEKNTINNLKSYLMLLDNYWLHLKRKKKSRNVRLVFG